MKECLLTSRLGIGGCRRRLDEPLESGLEALIDILRCDSTGTVSPARDNLQRSRPALIAKARPRHPSGNFE